MLKMAKLHRSAKFGRNRLWRNKHKPSDGRGSCLWTTGARTDSAVTKTFAFKRRQEGVARRQRP